MPYVFFIFIQKSHASGVNQCPCQTFNKSVSEIFL